MKINNGVLVSLLWYLQRSHAGLIQPVVRKSAATHPNLHSSYISTVDGVTVTSQLLVEGYTGEVETITLPNDTYVPKYHYVTTKELAIRNTDLVVRADVCVYLTDCAGLLKDFAAFYALKALNGFGDWCLTAAQTFSDYFTANNYAHATAVLDGTISSLALLVPGTIAVYYLNAQFDKIAPTSSDACGTTQPSVMAEQAASAVAEFCLSVKNQALADVTTRFSAADLNNPDAGDDENAGDGNDLIMKFNFGSLEFDVLALCTANGITWRRDFTAALIRGRERLG